MTDNSRAAVAAGPGLAHRLLLRVVAVRPDEVRVALWCWLSIFAVLSSYYIMRPIREQMGVAGGVGNLQWLFTASFAGMLVANLLFSALVKRLPRRRFIPLTYRFFALNILAFAAALHFVDAQQSVWLGRAFFVWISIYNLFVVSVFWQLNVDLFSAEQGRRLFGFIAAGATLGAIVGSAATAILARHVPPGLLLVGAAALLELAVFSTVRLAVLSPALQARPEQVSARDERPIGGSIVAGVTHAVRSPYLLNIAAFLLLYATTSTFLYFQQAAIVSRSFAERGAQTAFFATIDLCVNGLTLVIQLLLTGRIVVSLGVALTLALLPAFTMIGFGALALLPSAGMLAVVQIVRRAGDYAIARPTRELLFTVAPREDRYKTKGFIDTFIYRLGDQLGAWSTALLREAGGALATAAAIVAAGLWLVNALWLGRRQRALEIAARQTGER